MTIIPVMFGGDVVGEAHVDADSNNVTLNVTVSNSLIVSIFVDPDEVDSEKPAPTLNLSLAVKNGKSHVHVF